MNKNLIGVFLGGAVALAAVVVVLYKVIFEGDAVFLDDAIFMLSSTGAIALAVLAVTRKNPVYSILNLLGVFIFVAIMFFVLAADLMAVLQILVYAGAILMLFLFVLMLFNLGSSDPAAEEAKAYGEEPSRPSAEEAESTGVLFKIDSPKMQALVWAGAVGALLMMPIQALDERWDRFPDRYAPADGGVVEGDAGTFRVWVDLDEYQGEPGENTQVVPATVTDGVEGGGALQVTTEQKGEGDDIRRWTRLIWTGPMSHKTRDQLSAKIEAGWWTDAVRELSETAEWQMLERRGMTPAEVAHHAPTEEPVAIRTRQQLATAAARGEYTPDPNADPPPPGTPSQLPGFGSIPRVGWDLFDQYLIPFEFVSLILLAGMVGVVVVAMRRREDEEEEHGGPSVALFERGQEERAGLGLESAPHLRERVVGLDTPEDYDPDAPVDVTSDDDED